MDPKLYFDFFKSEWPDGTCGSTRIRDAAQPDVGHERIKALHAFHEYSRDILLFTVLFFEESFFVFWKEW